jgi:prepilin-type N-terminal cleavage/methylation domain-containing protein
MKINLNKKAFTLLELIIAVSIALVAFLMIYKFLSGTRHHYMYGTVNLQNFQQGRLAINYLRRDFSCASPRLENPDDIGYTDFQKTRKQIFLTPSWSSDGGDGLIQIMPHGLLFHRLMYNSVNENPVVAMVKYEFDASSKTLIRTGADGKKQKFTGIENVNFKVYTHQLNNRVPVLWVKLLIHEGDNTHGKDSIGKALELTSSITSPFINSSVNNKYWRYELGHNNL